MRGSDQAEQEEEEALKLEVLGSSSYQQGCGGGYYVRTLKEAPKSCRRLARPMMVALDGNGGG